jgi:hypothetical protein
MKNIQLLSPLMTLLFDFQKKELNIYPHDDFNIVDTTLIPTKQSIYITQKDWDKGIVTRREKDKNKINICGKKALVMINSHKYIYFAKLFNINYHDQNIFKDLMIYHVKKCFNGTMLMDRGFSNKKVRQRFNNIGINIVSPYHYKTNTFFTPEEKILYKKRWLIETVFQSLKNNYSQIALNLTKFKHKNFINAKFLATVILFNLSISQNQ